MYSTATRSIFIVLGVIAFVLSATPVRAQVPCPCVLPDNANGTVTMPPACTNGYEGPLEIVQGLFGGATINIDAKLFNFQGVVEAAGGSLGGTVSTFTADLAMDMQGTGVLAGFNRFLMPVVTGEIHWGARTVNDPVQTFAGDLFTLTFNLIGDPDFQLLRLTAGTGNGMPAPGNTTLTRQGGIGTDFQVDSFFDIIYRIEFTGAAGSVLENQSGSTQAGSRIEVCPGGGQVPTELTSWGAVKALYR